MEDVEVFYPLTKADWRNWLEDNHLSKKSVWLVFYVKSSGKPSISWREAVDMALCFGWIDSKKVKIYAERSHQFFSKRKPKSTWSKINKEKVKELMEMGLMAEAGLAAIEIAKQNGSWTSLDTVEELIIPADLELAFEKQRGSRDYFVGLSKSMRKMMLYWIESARRPETRQKRIDELAELAAQGKKPKQF